MSTLYDFSTHTLSGNALDLAQYRDKLVLIVNTASKCGFTKQYEGLQRLHDDYAARGLVLLGFPCNQFGAQEPGSADEISSFCSLNYGVSFQMCEKIDVNGANTDPLFAWLKTSAPGLLGTGAVKWNFTKFLVGCDGTSVTRYAPNVEPASLVEHIESQLPPG